MKLIQASSGKTRIILTKKEWQEIGRTAQWVKSPKSESLNPETLRKTLDQSEKITTEKGEVLTLEQVCQRLRRNIDFQHELPPEVRNIPKIKKCMVEGYELKQQRIKDQEKPMHEGDGIA